MKLKAEAPSQHGEPANESPVRIFIVDDDKLAREAIAAILVASGYRVSIYCDAKEFLAKIRPTDFGCLLLDISRPGMDGIQLTERLSRARAPFVVLIISGHADVALAVKA